MITRETVLKYNSELGMLPEFVVVLYDETKIEEAEDIMDAACSQWFEDDGCDTLTDRVRTELENAGIEYEMFFEEEDEDFEWD